MFSPFGLAPVSVCILLQASGSISSVFIVSSAGLVPNGAVQVCGFWLSFAVSVSRVSAKSQQ